MKKTILLFAVLFFTVFISTINANVVLAKTNTSTSSSRQRAPMLIPVTVDLSTTELYLNFTNTVGIATITVTNSNGTIVQQDLLDTDASNELNIPLDGYEAGVYTFTISYGSVTLTGNFELE